MKKAFLPVALILGIALLFAAPARATVDGTSVANTTQALLETTSGHGIDCHAAATIEMVAQDAGNDFNGTVDIQFRPNERVGWQTWVTGYALGTTRSWVDPGWYRFYVHAGGAGAVYATLDAYDVHGGRVH